MSGSTIVKPIGGKSAEEIAYDLFRHILDVEGKELDLHGFTGAHPPEKVATRDYILDTYAECQRAVKGLRDNNPKPRISGAVIVS